MSTFTAKTWHDNGSSYPILIDQNPETPIQCYYGFLNQAFEKHLAEPVPTTQEWANFKHLDWKCSGEALEEFLSKDLPDRIHREYEAAKQSANDKMEQLDPASDKYKIFTYFIRALKDGEEHLRFFIGDDNWYLVNWGMYSDPKYVLMLPNPKLGQNDEPEEDTYARLHKDSILSVPDIDIDQPMDDLIPEEPPLNVGGQYKGVSTDGHTEDSSYGWLKWLIVIILLLAVLYFLWGHFFPRAEILERVDNSITETNQVQDYKSESDDISKLDKNASNSPDNINNETSQHGKQDSNGVSNHQAPSGTSSAKDGPKEDVAEASNSPSSPNVNNRNSPNNSGKANPGNWTWFI